MGDRTWARLYCRREDQAVFAAAGMRPEHEQSEGDTTLALYVGIGEPFYALDTPITDRPYIYAHGAGINYGAGEVVCDGTTLSEVSAGYAENSYVIVWPRRDADLERLDLHMQLRKKVCEMLGTEEWL